MISETDCTDITVESAANRQRAFITTEKSQWPLAARSTAWVCGNSLAGVAGLNPQGPGMSVVSAVCYQGDVCASGGPFTQRISTECCVAEYEPETLKT